MNKLSIIIVFILMGFLNCFAQKTISGKSQPTKLVLIPKYERGLPPNLFVELDFKDDNHNNILEADEGAQLQINLRNDGKGPAQNLVIKVTDADSDPNLVIKDGVNVPFLYPGQTRLVTIPIQAKRFIGTGDHSLNITITENFGYDMDPARLILKSMEYLKPNLVFSGVEVVDVGPGTAGIIEDGRLQIGESVKVKVVVQNIGQNLAYSTRYQVESTDSNIYLSESSGDLGNLKIGEVKEFWITLSPNKRVQNKGLLPVFLTLTNREGYGNLAKYQLPLKLDQKPPETKIHEVKADIESLISQVTRFEFNSSKIKANVGNVIDIHQVAPSKTRRANSIAIVIGIERYRNFVPAPYAANDANIMAEYFKNVLGIETILNFTNDKVSGFFFQDKFSPQFGELQRAVVKGETEIFVFYSGHGLPSKDGSRVFLLPSDGRIEALETQGYDLDMLYSNLNALQAKSVVVILDACFSGASRASESHNVQNLVSMKGAVIKPKINKPWESNPNFTVFTSSDYDQTSLGFDDTGTGLFTYYVCAGLQGKADQNGDNRITTGELRDYVIREVTATSLKIMGLQTPKFFGNPDLILGEY